jgi:peroxiredoxin
MPLLAFSQVTKKGFTITGKAPGIKDGVEVKLIPNNTSAEIAKTKVIKGSFVLTGSVTEPTLCGLMIDDSQPIDMYVENSKMTIAPDKKKPGKYVITGSSSHKDFDTFLTLFSPLVQQLSSLATTINTSIPGAGRDALMQTYTGMQKKIQDQIDTFILKRPRSVVSPFVLLVTMDFNDDALLLEKRYFMLDSTIRKTSGGQQLAQVIATKKIGAVGTLSMDFTQPDTTGIPVSLSSFHGKYVLVDFWASWCGPCRNENPNVVENFNKFKNKNFTILQVSLDKPGQKDNWMEAIHKDGLTWTHVSDLQFWNNAAAQLYHINSIPQNFLIDPDGKIIAKNLRGPELQAKLCEIFGCN